jgi:tRNA-(ms[2]io[6]A)-hydroxylase
MLHLARKTEDDWYDRVSDDIDKLLIDHAHLEKRAASTALAMVFKYTSKMRLARELSQIVREEMEHFEIMLDVLEARGVAFGQLDPAPYAKMLVKHVRRQEPEALLDKLLVAGLIEARSCERFQILSRRLEDQELRELYADLAEQEAHHHMLYTNLAREYFDHQVVRERLDELAELEVEAIDAGAGLARLHSA